MTRTISIALIVVCMATPFAAIKPGTSQQKTKDETKAPVNGNSIRAEITNKQGKVITVEDVGYLETYWCDGTLGATYVGTPTETSFTRNYYPVTIKLKQDKGSLSQGQYILQVPLEIIKNITRIKEESYEASFTLSDNTIVKGNIYNNFHHGFITGKAELGELKISPSDIMAISFKHEPKLSFNATTEGNSKLSVYLKDGTEMNLFRASFVTALKNRNGCQTSETYLKAMKFFEEGGASYDVPWERIKAITMIGNRGEMKLVTKSGSEYKGKIDINTQIIEGATKAGAFNLKVQFPILYGDLEGVKFLVID